MGTLARREREKLDRRNSIISVAKELFFEMGYRTTMKEIAAKAELSIGALYYYFNSKDELYISIILEAFTLLEDRLKKAAACDQSIEKRLKSIYFAYVEFCLENREYFRIIQYFLSYSARRNASVDAIETINKRVPELLEPGVKVFQEGVESGVFNRHLNPYAACIVAYRMAAGILDLAISDDPLNARAGTYGELFELGITLLINGARKPR